ncbi:MAG: cell division protein FtsZ [Oscillospiraceae bacterium]|nr:cell division protein FtsZ [Oscillospiraceae bacterium]
MAIQFDEEFVEEFVDDLDTDSVFDLKILVVGVGGGGGNAIEHMAKLGVNGVEYVVVNTDVPALKTKDRALMRRVQIGKKTTKGRGAGGDPTVGAESAKENNDDIRSVLEGVTLLFISAGMGGGTGTGAAPVIAELAKSMGILTIGVVTKPFDFERDHKMNQALKGIAEMRKHVDALVIIPNQRLLKLGEKALNFKQAYTMVDNVLYNVVKNISELLNETSYMNIDFADLRATLESAGDAHIAIGVGMGEKKIDDAVYKVVNSPLLETTIENAGKLLISVSMAEETDIHAVQEIMDRITGAAHPDVKVIHGASWDASLKDEIVVTVIATCFNKEEEESNIVSDVRVHEIHPQPRVEDDRVFVKKEPTATGALDELIDSLNKNPYSDEDPFRDIEDIFSKR